jgi:hypothetical protein
VVLVELDKQVLLVEQAELDKQVLLVELAV